MFEGEARLKAGEPKQAVAQFEKAVKLLPGEWRAWNYLGLARHRDWVRHPDWVRHLIQKRKTVVAPISKLRCQS